MKSGTQDNAEVKLHKVKGKIKEVFEKIVWNPDDDNNHLGPCRRK
jgi:uncharacterized protein YjbJ (UPF0337 family)